MAVIPPDGLNASSLIAAKGAELKFWIIKTNESAEKKVLNVSGTVETLRSNLAAYYGFDLTINPRVETINVPTVDESIRDRQWADLVTLGVEWKETIKAGKRFKLLEPVLDTSKHSVESILSMDQDQPNLLNEETVVHASPISLNPTSASLGSVANHSEPGLRTSTSLSVHNMTPSSEILSTKPTQSTSVSMSSSAPSKQNTSAVQREASILDDISTVIAGLQRCEGLRQVIEQIELGQVQSIRDRYGPSEPGRRGTAHPSWPKYSNLVSKRERIHRVLTQDFAGDKDRFFNFFTVSASSSKKRKRQTEPSAPTEHFRSFRKIVEAIPWCENDISVERQNAEYFDSTGEFSKVEWGNRWGSRNSWEIWRELGKERYDKKGESKD
ncbi:hypothetical protein R3P38DRAFT_3419544 [Favolaschia claudopus]|uniref:Uncharacterized protein n=1 Tax=Favolaschia claudopus TaxID=2862362 RepID=A0AAW0EIY3_9AGAR